MRCASNERPSPPFPLVQLDTPTIDYEPINAAGEELKSGIDRILVRKLLEKKLKIFLEIIGKRRMDNDSHPNLKNIFVNRNLVSLLYCNVLDRFSHSVSFTFMVPCIILYSMNKQQMQLYAVNFIPLLGSLHMFRVLYTPIIRSTIFNCIYSHWYKP